MDHAASAQMAQLLRDIFPAGMYSDLTLVARDGKEFQAHKFALHAQSPVFATMLGGQFKEGTANTNRITLDDNADALEMMLYHIYQQSYTQAMSPNAKRMVSTVNVYAIADKYDVAALRTQTLSNLDKLLDPTADMGDYIAAVKAADANTASISGKLWDVLIENMRRHIGVLRKTNEFMVLLGEKPALCSELLGLLETREDERGYIPTSSWYTAESGGGRRLGGD